MEELKCTIKLPDMQRTKENSSRSPQRLYRQLFLVQPEVLPPDFDRLLRAFAFDDQIADRPEKFIQPGNIPDRKKTPDDPGVIKPKKVFRTIGIAGEQESSEMFEGGLHCQVHFRQNPP